MKVWSRLPYPWCKEALDIGACPCHRWEYDLGKVLECHDAGQTDPSSCSRKAEIIIPLHTRCQTCRLAMATMNSLLNVDHVYVLTL